MTCEEKQSWISNYADDSLPSDRVGAMFGHLAECVDCQRFLQTALRIRAAMRGIPMETPPQTVDEAVVERLQGNRSNIRPTVDVWSVRIAVPLPAAVAMAVLLIVGSFIVSPLTTARALNSQRPDQHVERIAVSIQEAMRTASTILGR